MLQDSKRCSICNRPIRRNASCVAGTAFRGPCHWTCYEREPIPSTKSSAGEGS